MNDFQIKLKKLINGLDIDTAVNAGHKQKLKQQVLDVYKRQNTLKSLWEFIMERKITHLAAAAIILLAAVIGIAVLKDNSKSQDNQPVATVDKSPDEKTTQTQAVNQDTDTPAVLKSELELANKLYAQKDANGLIAMLQTGQFTSKIIAANYLASIGDSSAVKPLEQLSEKYGKDSPDNPFAKAVKAIAEKQTPHEPNQPMENKDSNSIVDKNNILILTVMAEDTNKPLVGAAINARFDDCRKSYTTDSSGKCRVDIGSGKVGSYRVDINYDGFVPKSLSAWTDSGNQIEVPRSYTIKLEKGSLIGGFVDDPNGNPVENAEVKINFSINDRGGIVRALIDDCKVNTDSEGFWQFDMTPSDFGQVGITVSHPNFTADCSWVEFNSQEHKKLATLEYITKLQKTFSLTGIVVDDSNNQITGADIAIGYDRYAQEDFVTAKTNNAGNFTTTNVRPNKYDHYNNLMAGEIVLTVQKEGFAPELKIININMQQPAIIKLSPGKTIKGQVVDKDGKPIADVRVEADNWRQFRSIRWQANTDTQGKFIWNDAPADEVQFSFGKQGYTYVNQEIFIASNEEYILTLYPPLKISGTVKDANTGELIKSFTVLKGNQSEDGRQYFPDDMPNACSDGLYTINFSQDLPGNLLKVEADGYLPVISRSFTTEEVDVVYDFKLTKGDGLTATVYCPDGTAAVNAEICLSTTIQNNVYIRSGVVINRSRATIYKTDKNGKFQMPPQVAKYKLIICDPNGYAVVDKSEFEISNKIILKPWAKIYGIVRSGSKPLANQAVALYLNNNANFDPNEPRFDWNYTTTTDANGYYEFTEVLSGSISVSLAQVNGNSTRHTRSTSVSVEPGQTLEVNIGGGGRKVIGKIILPSDYNEPIDFTKANGYINFMPSGFNKNMHADFFKQYMPANYETMTIAQRTEWSNQWQKSEQFKDAHNKMQEMLKSQNIEAKNYSIIVNQDGTFEVDDVTEGTYMLYINVQKPLEKFRYENIGKITHTFELPASDSLDEPYDLGQFELNVVRNLKAGDNLPEFNAETANGKKISSNDLKGKIILLNIWSGGENEKDNFKALEQLQNQYRDRTDFAIIGLAMEYSYRVYDQIKNLYRIDWPLYYIHYKMMDTETFEKFQSQFGIKTMPLNILIDKDGKIIKAYIQPDQLADTVKGYLEKQ